MCYGSHKLPFLVLARLDRPLLRLILLTLLVLMPLRMAWSAAAGYCAHEVDVAAAHFGHHTHAHAHPDASEVGESHATGLSDPDCSACHAWLGHLPALPPATLVMAPAGYETSAIQVALPSQLLPDIERPKWRGAA